MNEKCRKYLKINHREQNKSGEKYISQLQFRTNILRLKFKKNGQRFYVETNYNLSKGKQNAIMIPDSNMDATALPGLQKKLAIFLSRFLSLEFPKKR